MPKKKPKSRKRPPPKPRREFELIIPIVLRMLKHTRHVSETERRQVHAALDKTK